MINQFKFSQARVRDLESPKSGRVDHVDLDITKLICRVSATGTKSFIVRKRVNGKLKNITLGKFPDMSVTEARIKAAQVLTKLANGIDPTEEKRKAKFTSISLGDVLESYLDCRDLKPITVAGYRYKLKQCFADWVDKPASNITSKMVMARHKKLSEIGKTTANTAMRVLRLTLRYAKEMEMVESVATDKLSGVKLWHKNKRKERVIPSVELKAWHEAVASLTNERARLYLLMALYMGFRSHEILTLKWENVDLKAKKITMLDTKNGSDHTLPIPTALLPFITDLYSVTGDTAWVFASAKTGRAMVLPAKQLMAVTKLTGVEFSSHDCRRTFATIAEAVHLPMSMIKRLMNHVTSNDVTGGYIVTEEETLRIAINKVADYIQAKVTQIDNVVELTKAGAKR